MSNVAANLLSHASTTNGSMTTTQRTLNWSRLANFGTGRKV